MWLNFEGREEMQAGTLRWDPSFACRLRLRFPEATNCGEERASRRPERFPMDTRKPRGRKRRADQGRAQWAQQVVEVVRDFPVDTVAGREVDWEQAVRRMLAGAALAVESDPVKRQQVRRKLLQM